MAFLVPLAVSVFSNFLLSALAPTVEQEGPRLSNSAQTTSKYGEVLPRSYGSIRAPGKIIFSSGVREVKTTETDRPSKKGPKVENTTYTYFTTFAAAFLQGEQSELLRVWANNKLIYDVTQNNTQGFIGGDDGASFAEDQRSGAPIRFYSGSEDQLPDPKIKSIVDSRAGVPDSAPAFRGLCYVVFDEYEVTNFGGRLPKIEAEFSRGTESVSAFNAVPAADIEDNDILGRVFYDDADSIIRAQVGGDSFAQISYPAMSVRRYVERNVGPADAELVGAEDNVGILVHSPASNGSEISLVNLDTGDALATIGVTSASDRFSSTNLPSVEHAKYFTVNVSGNETTRFFAMAEDRGGIGIFKAESEAWTSVSSAMTDFENNSYADTFAVLVGPMIDQYRAIYVLSNDNGFSALRIREYLIDRSGQIKSRNQVFDVDDGQAGVSATWCESDNCILMFYFQNGVSYARRFTPQRLTNLTSHDADKEQGVTKHDKGWSRRIPIQVSIPEDIDNSQVTAGKFSWLVGRVLYIVDIFDGSLVALDQIDPNDAMLDQRGFQFYDGSRGAIITTTDYGYTAIFTNRVGRLAENLSEIVADICLAANLTEDEFDVTALDGVVCNGFISTGETSARAILTTLQQAYNFQGREIDGKIVFGLKNDDVVRIIKEDDLIDVESGDKGFQRYIPTRIAENELPSEMQITYYDLDRNYEQGHQHWKRARFPFPTHFSDRKVDNKWNIVLTADEGIQQCQRLLYQAYVERERHKYSLLPKHMDLDPGDVIQVELDNGKVFRERITEFDTGVAFNSEVNTTLIDPETFVANGVGSVGDGVPVQAVDGVVGTKFFFLDIPILDNLDNPTSDTFITAYFAVAARAEGWAFAQVERSTDQTTYADYGFQNIDTGWGSVVGVMPPATHGAATDTENEITVRFRTEVTLSSITRSEFLDGALNLILIGDEIIQYQTATKGEGNDWVLSDLRRGYRGTEWAIDTQPPSATAIALTGSAIETLMLPSADKGALRFYRAVSKNQFSEQAIIEEVILEGASLRPFAPDHLTRADSGGDSVLSWLRRDRLKPIEFEDGSATVPLSEDTEEYKVYVLSAAYEGGDSIPDAPVRTATVTTPTWTYAAADMTADGFDPVTDTLHVIVTQQSARVGDGFPGPANLEPNPI